MIRWLSIGICGAGVLCGMACAHRVSPSGGAKDTIPPSLVYSEPKSQALSFRGQRLVLAFDEWIDENALKKNLIITPDDMGRDFKYQIRGKRLILSFKDPFRDSTTYTLNVSEAITDITERNKARNAILAFSTTSYIDSLRIGGVVREAYTQTLVKDAIVGLSSPADSTDFAQRRFIYFVSTDEEGRFSFINLKEGAYRIYAFRDENKNGVMEIEEEWHGFVADTLDLREDIDSLDIGLVRVDARALMGLTARPTGPYFDVRYNKRIMTYRVEVVDSALVADTLFYHLIDEGRILRFYPAQLLEDSIAIRVVVRDAVDNLWEERIFLRFQEGRPRKRDFSLKALVKEKVSASSDELMLEIRLTKPARAFDVAKIRQWENDSISYPVVIEKSSWNESYDTWRFSQRIIHGDDQANRDYHWLLEKGAFVSVENDSSEEETVSHKILDSRLFGTVSGELHTEEKTFILEIIDRNYVAQEEMKNAKKFSFHRLREGQYRFRWIIDKDKDGHWDTGNILKNKAPEPVYILEESVKVKAHWTVENLQLSP